MIIRGGQAILIPASLATPNELAQGVTDIDRLCFHVANEYLRAKHAHLAADAFEDLAAYLMLAAWEEAGRYQTGTGTLVGYLSARLAWRCTDWYRERFGRRREPLPVAAPLDEADGATVDPFEVDDIAARLGVTSRIGRWTLLHIAVPHMDGEPLTDSAHRLGMSRAVIETHMAQLRCEIEGGLGATA